MIKRTSEYSIQYEQEMLYQEINANKNTLRGFLWFLIAVALIWLLTMIGFFEVDKALISYAFFLMPFFFFRCYSFTIKGTCQPLG